MGLGPNGTSILPRIGVEPLSDKTAEELEDWIRAKQLERTGARALGALKRREKAAPKVKVPKPRRHKHHCYCVPRHSGDEPICCRCKGATCLKPKKPKRPKATAGTISLAAPAVPASATSAEKA